MTGESDTVKKNNSRPFLLSGTQIAEGSCKMMAISVGMNSEWGEIYSKLITPREATPLQEGLEQMAKQIGYIGTVVAIGVFIILTIRFIVTHSKRNK